MKTPARRIAHTAIVLSAALIIGLIESLIPPVIPALPFLRLGLSNIALIFALIVLGAPPAYAIAIFKSVLVPLMVGNPVMIAYSLPSSVTALTATSLLARSQRLGLPVISAFSAIIHNMAQLCVAALMTGTPLVFGYAPYLIFTGIISGVGIGVISYLLIRYLPKKLFDGLY
jgi:heptaprenyl diphosphate synthase